MPLEGVSRHGRASPVCRPPDRNAGRPFDELGSVGLVIPKRPRHGIRRLARLHRSVPSDGSDARWPGCLQEPDPLGPGGAALGHEVDCRG